MSLSVLSRQLPLLALTLAGLALNGAALRGQEPAAVFRNPVIGGDLPDPSVIRVGDLYYAVGTSSEWAPYYPLYTSKDLVNWEPIGHVFDKKPDWTVGSFWAPELFYRNGIFYVYYTARRKADNVSVIGVATSDDPRKGFTDRGIIREWGSEAIDGFVLQDNDGKLYFSWKAYGLEKDRPVALMACEMEDDGLKLKSEAFELKQADGKPISAEGQVMTRRGDWYYLFYSSQGCCGRDCDYQLEVARSKSVKGPWETSPYNPILSGGGDWKCPGHGTLVSLPDQRDYFLYHSYNTKTNVFTGRQGMLGEVAWSRDGWPFFAAGPHPSTSAASPLGKAQAANPQDFTDLFDGLSLSPRWEWDIRHEPVTKIAEGTLQLTIPQAGETGALNLGPKNHLPVTGAEDSDASLAGTFLGTRVQRGDYTFTATVDRKGSAQEGIAIYGEAKSLLGIRIDTSGPDDQTVVWKIQKGKPEKLASAVLPKSSKLQLRMTVLDGHRFRFSWSADGHKWQDLGDQEIDGAFLPPWDRAPRAGLIVAGKPGDTGIFDSVELRYDHP